ncbi:hypothetical protein ABT024_05065 [Streptomyces sp. NPDC002812]|uniref:hypothetical protein n=1 Tax=Streptomyces sp. NPDC002812 TaxID=3154434 RepID=UPI0033284FF8
MANIVQRYAQGQGETCEQIARYLRTQGVVTSSSTIRSVLKAAGVFHPRPPGRRAKQVPDLERLGERYAAGESLTALAPEAGVSMDTLARKFEAAGYKEPACRRPQAAGPALPSGIVEQYRRGADLGALAAELGVSSDALLALLRFNGALRNR